MQWKLVCYLTFTFFVLAVGCDHKAPVKPEPPEVLPQWPVWGGNLRHTANAADPVEFYVGPELGQEVWSERVSGDVGGSPSIHSDGTIYVGSGPPNLRADSGFVLAFRPDGTLMWRFRTKRPILMSGAVGQDGTYYVGDIGGNAYAIDGQGRTKWKREIGRISGSHPIITANELVVFPGEEKLCALHAETGEPMWERPLENSVIGLSVSSEGILYVAAENIILAVKEDGTLVWQRTFTGSAQEVIISANGTLYFQLHNDSLVYALSPDGTPKWTFNIGARSDFHIPAISASGELYVVKPITPQQLLILNSEGALLRRINLVEVSEAESGVAVTYSYPMVDLEGTAYLSFLPEGATGNFYAIRKNGLLKWKVLLAPDHPFLPPTKPAIARDGTLYVTSDFSLHSIR